MKITKEQAIKHDRTGVEGIYYQLPEVRGGTTIAKAIFTGEHGKRIIGETPRIYYITKGAAKFIINDKTIEATEEDTILIPANATYNLFPITKSVEVLLFMEFLDFDKLPKK